MTSSFDFLTIGHSNLPADQFLARLKAHNVTAIADVRSVPFSRRFPWFSSRTLSERLQTKQIAYIMMGDTLGGRPTNPALYCDGVADYEAMAGTDEFRAGIDRVVSETARHCLCLMCSEREPLECHRCLLVGRALTSRGHAVGHILGDGTIEPHSATEERLMSALPPAGGLFEQAPDARLADAYRYQAHRIAARLSDRVRPGRSPRAFMSS